MNNIKITNIAYSKDNITRKYVQKTEDSYRIETTYVDYSNKHIICFSTQIGCNLGCKFCYNGLKHNFVRNLTVLELCNQIENVIASEQITNNKPILFSAMGIGEPLLNYENLILAFYYLNEKYPNSKFALATTGIDLRKIFNLAIDLKELNFKLTISLHATTNQKRSLLIPIYNDINALIETVKQYETISDKKVEWNYVLIKGINDSQEDAKALYELLGSSELIKINKFNKVEPSDLIGSENIEEFIKELRKHKMNVEYYETNGEDINAACGQMISEEVRRTLKYENRKTNTRTT